MFLKQEERIFNAYRERASSGDWAKWAEDNPEENELLNMAMKAANGS